MYRHDLEGCKAGVDLQVGFMCSLDGDPLSSWSRSKGINKCRKSVGDAGCLERSEREHAVRYQDIHQRRRVHGPKAMFIAITLA